MAKIYQRHPALIATAGALVPIALGAGLSAFAFSGKSQVTPLTSQQLPEPAVTVEPKLIDAIEQLERARPFVEEPPMSADEAKDQKLLRDLPEGIEPHLSAESVKLGHHAVHIEDFDAERCRAYALAAKQESTPAAAGWHCVEPPDEQPQLLYRAWSVPESKRGYYAFRLETQRTLEGGLRYRLETDEELLDECPGELLDPGKTSIETTGTYCVRAFAGQPNGIEAVQGYYYPGEPIAELALATGGGSYELKLRAHQREEKEGS